MALARSDGVPDGQLAVGALPSWLVDERAAGARSLAEVAVRRALFPDHPLVFTEPDTHPEQTAAWPHILAASLAFSGDHAIVLRRPGRTLAVARETRAAARVAAEIGAARESSGLSGIALDHARGEVGVALATLDMLADRGWRAIAGETPDMASARALGGDAVAERTETFDPFASMLGSLG